MRSTLIALLCVAGFVSGAVFASSSLKKHREQQYYDDNDISEFGDDQQAKPFQAGNEYTFTYNTQVSTGLVAPDTSEDPGMPQQKATTRMQSQAKIQFSSERHGSLQLQAIRFGQLNDQIPEPDRVKPMRIFEPKQIPEEKHRKLQLPCHFIYKDGVIERIQFHPQDDAWSKNLKRAVLNMIQLNLKKNNAQGLRLSEELSANANINDPDQNDDWEREPEKAKAFALPEITIEGNCETMYTVQQTSPSYNGQKQFNVTKSIDFKQCRKIADVAYGYQTEQIQPQCAQCQQQWYKQQRQNQQLTPEDQEQMQQQLRQSRVCEQQCDPKEVKEQKLSRFTVQRCVLEGDQKQYAVRRCEMTSQYVYKNLNAETGGPYASAMHAVVASELIFRGVQSKSQPSGQQPQQSSDKDETLLFSNENDVDEKRFYMYGDEGLPNSSPFKDAQNKEQQAEQALQKLVQTASNKDHGIEIEAPIQLQRLVETLRKCSVEELKKIDQQTSGNSRNDNNNQQQKKDMAEQFFADALAIAGTRNTIALLVEKILAKEMSPSNAVQSLRALRGLPAPSDSQVQLVQRLCHSEVCQRSESLMQACWLTFGSMINELCQHKTQRVAQQSIDGSLSGFDVDEVCPLEKKQKYREDLVQKFKNAQTTYEKVLALKALGNAGIPQCVVDLEQIIRDEAEELVVRIVAVDALRRQRVQMPVKIQDILMPVFLNHREQPQLRMSAFAQLMNTLPSEKVIDQIVYALTQERSKSVLSFAYSTMKSIAQTKNPIHREMVSKHIQNALKLLNVDEQTLKMTGRGQIPIYSAEQQEGVFVNLYSAFSERSALPVHVSASMNSMLNGEYSSSELGVSISQQNIDDWVEQLLKVLYNNDQQYFAKTRGERHQQPQSSSLRKIYTALGIKNRRQPTSPSSYNNREADKKPFAMLNFRIADVDQSIITINGGESEGASQRLLKTIMNKENNERLSLSQILAVLVNINGNNQGSQQMIRKTMATNLNEKWASIPTTSGLLLKAMQSFSVIGVVEVQTKLIHSGESALGAHVQGQIAVNVAHIQKLECQLPIFATGTKSIRSLELNMPINVEVTTSASHGLQIKIQPGKQSTQVLGLHTLPMTYTADFDQNKKTLREPRIKAIHNAIIEQSQREVNTVFGRAAGLPFHVKGHFYRPSKLTNYKQLVQMLMAAENQIHAEFRPAHNTPREVIIRIQGSQFERIQTESPKFEDFYSQMTFSSDNDAYDQEQGFENMESHNERRQKLNNYLSEGQYQRGQMYKHALKISAQCVGGQSNCKAEMEIQSSCDARFKFCKMNFDAERSAFNNEGHKWTLKAKAQILRPETVSIASELAELNQANRRFIAHAEAEWGTQNEEKQHLNVRIQAEQAMKQQWRQIEQFEEKRRSARDMEAIKRRTAFLNKFDLSADYKLQPAIQNTFRCAFEALKADNFFNTQSVLLNNNNNSKKQGQVRATVVIDPITQRHCNVSVQTPTEAVRIDSVELPGACRPFSLIRSSMEKPTHSAQQFLSRWAVSRRAECTADGRRVSTFDGAEYKAPIGKCYSVLAKDCTSDEPQFVVLMKTLENNNQEKRNEKEQAKKIKVITPEQTVECQPKSNEKRGKLSCKVNGRPVNNNNNDQQYEDSETVEFNNAQQSDVTINARAVSVRFNGEKLWIKIAREFKNGQCGLCGHYDDNAEDEWRMGNDERTDDLARFHRSYSLLEQNAESGECTADSQQEFYNQNMFTSGKKIWRTSASSSSESDENDDDENESWKSYDSQEDFNGEWNNERSASRIYNKKGNNNMYGNKRFSWLQDPVHQTVVIESGSTKICYSMEPVKQCPSGTFETSAKDAWKIDNDGDDSGYETDIVRKGKNLKTVKFACLSRSSLEARELLRQVRRGVVLNMSNHRSSLTESVVQATGKCARY